MPALRAEIGLTLLLSALVGCGSSQPTAPVTAGQEAVSAKSPDVSTMAASNSVIDFAAVEQALKIKLPKYYRHLIETKGAELEKLTTARYKGDREHYDYLFLYAKTMIYHNDYAKAEEQDLLPKAAHGWWQKYVIVGTNGAGGYFAIRLDGEPGVWNFGSDDGDGITKIDKSFERMLDEEISDYQAEDSR